MLLLWFGRPWVEKVWRDMWRGGAVLLARVLAGRLEGAQGYAQLPEGVG
jgi:hypothetical protein